jgi:hypothetical protein
MIKILDDTAFNAPRYHGLPLVLAFETQPGVEKERVLST